MSRRLTARYTPDPAPENTEELPGYLANSLSQVGEMINSPTRNFAPLNSAPPKPTDGDVAFADGVGWDPGYGNGLYVYFNSTWFPLISPDVPGTVPIGGIIIWTGSTVPGGWALCDGSNAPNGVSTPDLRDRFVKGAGAVSVGTAGGAVNTGTHVLTTAEMPSHNHTGPNHDHGQQGTFETDLKGSHSHGAFSYIASRFQTLVSGANWNIFEAGEPETIQPDGSHTHSVSISGATKLSGNQNTGNKGSSGGHKHTLDPVYYAVAYIMRYE